MNTVFRDLTVLGRVLKGSGFCRASRSIGSSRSPNSRAALRSLRYLSPACRAVFYRGQSLSQIVGGVFGR
jgi:hypothetical protein